MTRTVLGFLGSVILLGAIASLGHACGAAIQSSVEASRVEPLLGPGYIENVEDITCADAGTAITPNCAGLSLSCECSAAALFGNDSVIPLTGRAETNFDGNVRSISCRSQSNVTCDCWSLCATQPN